MTLTHRQAERFLEQSLDGPLPHEQRQRLQAHLRDCAACRAYAEQSTRFHSQLSQALPELWPHRRASRAQLARTVEQVTAHQSPRRAWFAASAQAVLRLALLLLLAGAAFWHFDRQSSRPEDMAPEDAAFIDPAFPSPQLAGEALAVRFDLDFDNLPGERIEFYVPVCDGVEFVPSASALFRKLNLGQRMPDCSLQPGNTILLAPGDSHQLLLVYRNPSASAIQFRIEPTSRTALSQPFAEALCAPQGASGDCATYQAAPRALWAKFISFTAPPDSQPGAHVNVTARVHWTRGGG